MRHVTLTTPVSGMICRRQLGCAMINLPAKFEMSVFACYGNMKGVAKC